MDRAVSLLVSRGWPPSVGANRRLTRWISPIFVDIRDTAILTHLINPLPGRRNRAKELGDEDVDRTAHSRGALNADFFRFGRDCHLPLFHK